ncbi:MAG: Error-prone repair protein ImuA, partial [Bacteroidota bacterium]|nr:Error-prone repair protein ImuA [Bacteroidota bacterium]
MKTKADILVRLQREMLALQGIRSSPCNQDDETSFGPINQSFPDATFPVTAVHEFFCTSMEERAASSAFISGILSSRIRKGGTALWVSASQKIFPPALTLLDILPDQIIFIYLRNEKEISWVVEEALKCNILTAVACEMQELSFTTSRRFQLAIEKSGVPLFVLRYHPKNLATTAVTRWHIKPLPTQMKDELPGVGYPRWQVNLLKVR